LGHPVYRINTEKHDVFDFVDITNLNLVRKNKYRLKSITINVL